MSYLPTIHISFLWHEVVPTTVCIFALCLQGYCITYKCSVIDIEIIAMWYLGRRKVWKSVVLLLFGGHNLPPLVEITDLPKSGVSLAPPGTPRDDRPVLTWRGGGGGMTNFLVMNKTIYAWLNRFLTLKETLNRLFVEKVWCEAEYLHNVQVILFEIDCTIFYTNELFCQLISWTN